MNRKLAFGISLAIMIITTTSIAAFMQLNTPKITVSGAWALYPMMVRWSEEYRRINPDIRIELSAGGAGKGMTDALTGLVDIGMVSREIYSEEIDQGAFWVAVVKDAVVPTMNKANPVSQQILATGLSKSVFLSIYLYENITTWGQAVGRPEIIDNIHVYTRSDSCGAAETWAQYLGGRQEDLKGTGVYGDPGVADAAKNDPLGIGFNNINYAYDPSSSKPIEGLTIIPIDLNGNGILDPDEDFYTTRNEIVDAIAAGTYPAPPSRELNLVTKTEFSATARDFVEWILTEGQQYAVETGYVQLSDSRLEEELSKLS
jgi:phosphate transport system substrate-binding protein